MDSKWQLEIIGLMVAFCDSTLTGFCPVLVFYQSCFDPPFSGPAFSIASG